MFKKIIIFTLALIFLHQKSDAQFVNHGPQVFAAAIQGSHFLIDSKGKEYVFTVVRGLPARLVGYELESNKVIVNSILEGTDGSWDMELATDNTLYMTGNGKMYAYTLGDKEAKDLGLALPNEKVIWDLVAGKSGKIYGGTYPGCRVFEYDPKNGFKDIGDGPVKQGEDYVRSVVYDGKTDMLYAGVGSHAAFVQLDIKSTKKSDILAEKDRDYEFVYDMELVKDVKGGDRILAMLSGSKGLETFIYNVQTKQYEKRFAAIEVKSIVQKPKTNKIYYTASGTVFELDLGSTNLQPRAITKVDGRGRTAYWDDKGNYKLLTASHKVFTIDVELGQILNEVLLDIPKSPISIQSIFWGPDKKVWSSGYLAGNHGTYDPATDRHEDYVGLHQTEGMNSVGNKIYFGNYTHAELFSYDVTQKWDTKQQNPKALGAIKDQDRPFAVLPLVSRNEVLFGTVPAYGKLGGAITHLNINTEKFETYTDVVANHSIMSLIEINGKVIGGTSIFGGLGAIPTEQRGRLFEWDPNTKKVLWTDSLDNYMSITGLFLGPDKGLWGFADGTLVKYDLEQKKFIFKKEIYTYKSRPSHIWRNGLAVVHPNGLIYFTLTDKFYSYDMKNDKLILLRDKASLMVLGDNNKIYFREGTDLWSYTPEGF